MPNEEPRLQTLGNLLQIEQDARQAESENAVEFIAVNDTARVVPYRQGALWRLGPDLRPALKLVSGLADLAGDSPYRQWLNRLIREFFERVPPGKAQIVTADALPEGLRDGWNEWMPATVVLVALPTPQGGSSGGLCLAVEEPPGESDLALLERLSWAYGQALWAWRPHPPAWRTWLLGARRRKKRLWLLVAVALSLPMRLTALAPAEISGKDAKLVAAPVDGVVAQFFVAPNQVVKAGTPLFALDDTTFRNRNEVAEKSQAVAKADQLRTMQKSFSDEASKAELASLNAKFEEKSAEAQYTRDVLERTKVSAPEAGIAVFSDPNDWLGKPVQTGERIVQIADPKRVQITINLPVDDAIALEPGAEVKLYLNISPLGAIDGVLAQASYEPAPVAEGFVAYRLKADLAPGQTLPRIGLKGTAKLYGHWAPLVYHIFRKPLALLRRTLGV